MQAEAGPEAQFEPLAAPDDQPAAVPLLEPPAAVAQAVAAAHLLDHGIDGFSVAEHVYLGGKRRPAQHLLWSPATATLDCRLCDTLIATGEITRERIVNAQLFDPGLKPFLAGPHTTGERDEITRRYLRGELTSALLRIEAKAERRRSLVDRRPTVAHRQRTVQAWMLERYAALGVVERVIEEALAMQRHERERWDQLSDKLLAAATLRRYWQLIDDARVAEAKAAYSARRRN